MHYYYLCINRYSLTKQMADMSIALVPSSEIYVTHRWQQSRWPTITWPTITWPRDQLSRDYRHKTILCDKRVENNNSDVHGVIWNLYIAISYRSNMASVPTYYGGMLYMLLQETTACHSWGRFKISSKWTFYNIIQHVMS